MSVEETFCFMVSELQGVFFPSYKLADDCFIAPVI